MSYIDSHSHLYLDEFSQDLPLVIGNAKEAGVSHVLLPNIDNTTIDSLLKVTEKYKGYCFPMMGLHPTSVNDSYKKELAIIEKYLKERDEFVAVGEIGLDLYWDKTYVNAQVKAFEYQLQLALEYNLPVVIHSRDAFELLYNTMAHYKDTPLKGIFHSFTGTEAEALKLLEFEDFLLGINGVVTFKNSKLPTVLQSVPLNRIALETDAPYLTPAPYRGKRNESAYLKFTLQKVADIYETTVEEIADVTTTGTMRIFDKLPTATERF